MAHTSKLLSKPAVSCGCHLIWFTIWENFFLLGQKKAHKQEA